MSLRDTTWLMDTAGTPKDSNSIIVSRQKGGVEEISSGGSTVSRTRTVVTRVWQGVTYAAGAAFQDCVAADTSNNDIVYLREKNRYTGEYEVTKTTDSKGGYA